MMNIAGVRRLLTAPPVMLEPGENPAMLVRRINFYVNL